MLGPLDLGSLLQGESMKKHVNVTQLDGEGKYRLDF